MALSASLLAPVKNVKDRIFRARSATHVDIAPVERPPIYKDWSEVAMVNAYTAESYLSENHQVGMGYHILP